MVRRFLGIDNNGRKGLGCRYVRDARAERYLMGPRITTLEAPRSKEWATGPSLDQGKQGSCVGHGWTHWRNAEPVQPTKFYDHAYAVEVYNYAQSVDEWTDTPPEEGTSVQAGAKAMVSHGALSEGYLWGTGIADLVTWVGNISPAVVGTLWLSGMEPNSDGFVFATGTIDGGHCYLVYGYEYEESTDKLVLKFQNSWGIRWGKAGKFYMYATEFQKLLSRRQFSICAPAELAPSPTPVPPEPGPSDTRVRARVRDIYYSPSDYYGKEVEIYERRYGVERTRWIAKPPGS